MRTKLILKFWTIADYLEEESWLRELHQQGWKLRKMVPPCFYTFESCEPEDVIYRLDYRNKKLGSDYDYIRMIEDFGWDYAGSCVGWLYFRKPAAEASCEEEGELFSDYASRLSMVEKLVRTRLLPLTIFFFCCVIPNALNAMSSHFGWFLSFLWGFMFSIYVILILHCGIKLKRMRKELQ